MSVISTSVISMSSMIAMTTRSLSRRFVALTATVLVAGGCTRAADGADQPPAVRIQTASDSSLISAPHVDQIPLVAVTPRDVADELHATGVVGPDITRTVPVNALGGGRVVAVRAKLGESVRKGQPLVVISSPDAGAAASDYQKFAASAALAQKQLERARILFEHGTIAKKDLETAEDAAQKAAVDLRTSAERVRMLGGSVEHPSPFIELSSPITGTIIEQNVTAASGLKSPDNAPNLFTVADLSRVWVMCDVYENDLGRVKLGTLARVQLTAYPDRTFTGRVGDIGKLLDPTTRAAHVRVELANPTGLMRQGMFAKITLVSPQRTRRLVVPTSAVLRLHDADWVFVKRDARSFRRTRVDGGRVTPDGQQEVRGEIAEGDLVVRNALQFSRTTEQ
jgi:cobalt-zinc-cadmium efflux system membrane fusion protein